MFADVSMKHCFLKDAEEFQRLLIAERHMTQAILSGLRGTGCKEMQDFTPGAASSGMSAGCLMEPMTISSLALVRFDKVAFARR